MKFFVYLLIIFFIYGCASSKPPQLEANLHSASYLNPNIYNQPSPVVVSIYQLKSPTAFQQANFFALYTNPSTTLANDLIDKSEIEIRPDQTQTTKQIISPETNFIGVVAAYRNPDNSQWRRILPIPNGKKVSMQINLAAQAVDIKID